MSFADWAATNCSIALNSTTKQCGANSLQLSSPGDAPHAVSTTMSFGNCQVYTGVASGTPSQGGLGLWAYLEANDSMVDLTIDFGSDSSNYCHYTPSIYGTDNEQRAGWNYFVAAMESPTSVTGTPNWTAAAYCKINMNLTAATTNYFDYLTISKSSAASPNRIGLNGLGYRFVNATETVTLL